MFCIAIFYLVQEQKAPVQEQKRSCHWSVIYTKFVCAFHFSNGLSKIFFRFESVGNQQLSFL